MHPENRHFLFWRKSIITSTCRSLAMRLLLTIIICRILALSLIKSQSIGYYPSLGLGFNPHTSPIFGYGLGLNYGAYGSSIVRDPWMIHSAIGYPVSSADVDLGTNLIGKIHAKSFIKKLNLSPYGYYGGFKNKIALMKHPEYAYTPYGLDYGYGKHYGSAVIPNNPYKSVYADYYNDATDLRPSPSMTHSSISSPSDHVQQTGYELDKTKFKSIMKPLVKAGVLLTTAALLGKKALASPLKLNPAGMIINGDIN